MFSENVATIDIQDLTRDFCIVLAPLSWYCKQQMVLMPPCECSGLIDNAIKGF